MKKINKTNRQGKHQKRKNKRCLLNIANWKKEQQYYKKKQKSQNKRWIEQTNRSRIKNKKIARAQKKQSSRIKKFAKVSRT